MPDNFLHCQEVVVLLGRMHVQLGHLQCVNTTIVDNSNAMPQKSNIGRMTIAAGPPLASDCTRNNNPVPDQFIPEPGHGPGPTCDVIIPAVRGRVYM